MTTWRDLVGAASHPLWIIRFSESSHQHRSERSSSTTYRYSMRRYSHSRDIHNTQWSDDEAAFVSISEEL